MGKTIDRIKEIADSNDITLTEMERIIGASKGVLTRAASKGTNIQLRWLEAIAEKFPVYNADWIIRGKGKPTDIEASIVVKNDRGEIIYADNNAKPEISYTDGVPYYDEIFECGFEELTAPSSESPDFLIRMPGYEKATLWCNASGQSMEPEINNGDIIALKRIDDFSFLPFGDIYGIITTNGMRTIKRLGKSSDPSCYRLIPTNKEYDEQDIPKDKILIVYRVMGAMKAF